MNNYESLLEEDDPYLEQSRQALDLRQTDPVRAFEQVLRLAESGSVNGMILLASAYELGLGTSVDFSVAETWYRHARDKSSKKGTFHLGGLYLKQKRYPEAYEAFTVASAMGHAKATDYVCQMGNREDWEYWENEPDLDGLKSAHSMLKTDPDRAFQELQRLVERGSPHSMLYLGSAYERGIGTSANIMQAKKWYRLAQEKGTKRVSKEAAYHLGRLYLEEKNNVMAYEAFSASAAMEYAPGIYRLGVMYRCGFGVTKQPDKARALFEKASALGEVFAKAEIAKQFMAGQFGFSNVFKGFYLFLRAYLNVRTLIGLLAKNSTYRFLRIVGFSLLVGYLAISRDFSFSITWLISYFAIAVFLVCMGVIVLNVPKRFPKLDRYHVFFDTGVKGKEKARSEDEWGLEQMNNLEVGFRNKAIFMTPSEDALICVPVIMAGIGPISAVLGGMVFGVLHLGRFTYMACIAKAVIYSLVCLFVLPHGLLTVIAGHFGLDLFVLVVLKATIKAVKAKGQ